LVFLFVLLACDLGIFVCVCFSLKRDNNNAQGGQSRASVPTVNSSPLESSNVSTPRSAAVQNGSHVQPQFQGKIVFLKEKEKKKKQKIVFYSNGLLLCEFCWRMLMGFY
jgi:hypothetical protein